MFDLHLSLHGASQVVTVMKNPPVNAGDVRGVDSILDGEDSPGEGHGNPLQYSCLENPMDRAAWRETVHRVAGRVRRNSSDLAAAAAVTLHIKYFYKASKKCT